LANENDQSNQNAYSQHSGEAASSGVVKDISKSKPIKKLKITLKKK